MEFLIKHFKKEKSMGYILGVVGGLIIGFSIGWLIFRPKLLGKLHIIKDETNEAYLFLAILEVILQPPDVKSQLIGKDPGSEKD